MLDPEDVASSPETEVRSRNSKILIFVASGNHDLRRENLSDFRKKEKPVRRSTYRRAVDAPSSPSPPSSHSATPSSTANSSPRTHPPQRPTLKRSPAEISGSLDESLEDSSSGISPVPSRGAGASTSSGASRTVVETVNTKSAFPIDVRSSRGTVESPLCGKCERPLFGKSSSWQGFLFHAVSKKE